MGRYRGPKNKLSRREGVDLFGRGSASLQRRLTVPPGAHGHKRARRLSEYGVQLREKQKVKRMYGLYEKQFVRYFGMASHGRGNVGTVLLQLLEQRLDNVVYRLGFGKTRPMARQLVTHRHVLMNGKRASIPSMSVHTGDTITLTPKALELPGVQESLDEARPVPQWLERSDTTGRMVRVPDRGEMEPGIHEELIVEFYSR